MAEISSSKSRIDKAGQFLAKPKDEFDANYLEEFLALEDVFDRYRESHLQPLTQLTSRLQHGLDQQEEDYYIAQRLKRKPQILRKLNRLSVRLTQLQDIGGLRVIANDDRHVDRISNIVDNIVDKSEQYTQSR